MKVLKLLKFLKSFFYLIMFRSTSISCMWCSWSKLLKWEERKLPKPTTGGGSHIFPNLLNSIHVISINTFSFGFFDVLLPLDFKLQILNWYKIFIIKWTILDHRGPYRLVWSVLDHLDQKGPFWSGLDHLDRSGSFWVCWGWWAWRVSWFLWV